MHESSLGELNIFFTNHQWSEKEPGSCKIGPCQTNHQMQKGLVFFLHWESKAQPQFLQIQPSLWACCLFLWPKFSPLFFRKFEAFGFPESEQQQIEERSTRDTWVRVFCKIVTGHVHCFGKKLEMLGIALYRALLQQKKLCEKKFGVKFFLEHSGWQKTSKNA